MATVTAVASNVRRSDCIVEHPGVDVDVAVTLPDGRVVEGEVTLCPAVDGSPYYASWGSSVDCWVSGELLEALDVLRDKDRDHENWRAALDEIERAAADLAGSPDEHRWSMIEFELKSAVGPRVKIWGEIDAGEVDAQCPDGWEVDWDTTPANLDSKRDGKRGYAHPLRAAYGKPLAAGQSYPD